MRRPRSDRIAALALAAVVTACRPAPPPPPSGPVATVWRATAERWQPSGDASTAALPTAVVGDERRPVLAIGEMVTLGAASPPADGARRVTLTVDVPETLRDVPLGLSAVTWPRPVRVVVKPAVLRSGSGRAVVHLRLGTGTGTVRKIAVQARRAPESVYVTGPVAVPTAARLRFALGVDMRHWRSDLPPAVFAVTALADEGETPVFHGRLDPGRQPADRRWVDQEVDLGALAGRTIRLRFTSGAEAAGPHAPLTHPVWGEPRLVAPAAAPRRNVLLVSLDTLRADRLGCYGSPRPTSPVLDRLAAGSVLFERAYAQFPGTSGSHMTLFTGLYPCQHGVEQLGLSEEDRLRPDAHTLAELLRSAGYTTAAFTEDGWVTAASGFARGFDVFVENTSPDLSKPTGHAAETFARTLDFIRRHTNEPWFVFAHTYQVHAPYTPPPGYLDRVLAPDEDVRGLLALALYDAEVRYTDEMLGTLLDGLTRLGLDDETILVVFSDHGDQFGEHGYFGHGNSLYDTLLHVPLIVRAPGLLPRGRRVPHEVGLIDVTPTLLALLDLPALRWTLGRNLAPFVERDKVAQPRLFAELPSAELVSARTPSLKWILSRRTRRGAAYNKRDDRGEEHDLAAYFPADAGPALLLEYERLCRAAPPVPPAPRPAAEIPIEPDVQQKLRALGYVE